MLYIPKNIDYKLPNGELIGGYLAFKGNIKDIEKYKDQDLLKKYPYIGPLPIFTVPFEATSYPNYKIMMENIKVLINVLFIMKIQIVITLKDVGVIVAIAVDVVPAIIII